MSIFTSKNRRWAFLLEIGGLPYRFYSGKAPPTAQLYGLEGSLAEQSYFKDVNAITNIGDLTASLDTLGGIAEYSSINIKLASDPQSAALSNPSIIFSRLGQRAASFVARVVQTIPFDEVPDGVVDPLIIRVDKDMSDLVYPRFIHVGLETFYAFGADEDADGFYVEVSKRALNNTVKGVHNANVLTGDFPFLYTDEIVAWRSRRCVLKAAEIYNVGIGNYVELMRGFIDVTPSVNQDNTEVEITLTPLIKLVQSELEITSVRTATMVEGYHYFVDGYASVMEVYQSNANMYQDNAEAASLEASGDLFVDAVRWAELFDEDLPTSHPRGGMLVTPRGFGTPVDTVVAANQLDVFAGPFENIAQGAHVFNDETIETKRAYIIEPAGANEVLIWPGVGVDGLDGVFGRINAVFDVDTHLGEDGALVNVFFDGSTAEMNVKLNPELPRANVPARIFVPATNGVNGIVSSSIFDIRTPWGTTAHPWDDSTLVDEFRTGYPEYWASDGVDPIARQPDSFIQNIMHAPFDFGRRQPRGDQGPGRYQWMYLSNASLGPELFSGTAYSDATRYKMVLPTAWYQSGERFMLFNEPVTAGQWRIRGEIAFGREDAIDFDIIQVNPFELDKGPRSGETVYLAEVVPAPDNNRGLISSFRIGVTSGDGRVRNDDQELITGPLVNRFFSREPTARTIPGIIKSLLRDEDKLALSNSDIDIASIDAIQSPFVASWRLPQFVEPVNISDILSALLIMCRSALVMRTDHLGRSRITRIDLTTESAAFATATINLGDWATSPVPSWTSEEGTTSKVIVRYEFVDEEFKEVVTLNSFAYQSLGGETNTLELDLYPLRDEGIDPTVLLPMAQGIFYTFGQPRRLWTGRVSSNKGLDCNLGSLVICTHPFLKGFDTRSGVINKVGRVVEYKMNYWEEGCDLSILHTGATDSGWNAAMIITEVVNTFTVVVAQNQYAPEEDPYTGEQVFDIDGFANGHDVYGVPRGNTDGRVELSISTVDRDAHEVVFNEEHGLVVGDLIEPRDYDDAAPLHKLYAFLADANGLIGAANIRGVELI